MDRNNEDEFEEVGIASMPVTRTPRIEDVVGTARTFLDDFMLGIEAEGICGTVKVSTDKTFLLEGKPGTGKTISVQALNNGLNEGYMLKADIYEHQKSRGQAAVAPDMKDLDLSIVEYSIGRHGSAYINRGSRIMQAFFDSAYERAKSGIKTVVALDEVDAIAGSRASHLQSHAEDRKILETLMKNLQIIHDTPNMYAILMTNLEDACDEASLRAGRIDKRYHFALPNPEERLIGFQQTIENLNRRADYQVVRGINYQELIEISNGFNYADIVQCVHASVKKRCMEVARDRTNKIIPALYITHKRLKDGVLEHKTQFHKDKNTRAIGFA